MRQESKIPGETGRTPLCRVHRLGTRQSLKRSPRGDSSGEFRRRELANGKRKPLRKVRRDGVRACAWLGSIMRGAMTRIATKFRGCNCRRVVRRVIRVTWNEFGSSQKPFMHLNFASDRRSNICNLKFTATGRCALFLAVHLFQEESKLMGRLLRPLVKPLLAIYRSALLPYLLAVLGLCMIFSACTLGPPSLPEKPPEDPLMLSASTVTLTLIPPRVGFQCRYYRRSWAQLAMSNQISSTLTLSIGLFPVREDSSLLLMSRLPTPLDRNTSWGYSSANPDLLPSRSDSLTGFGRQ